MYKKLSFYFSWLLVMGSFGFWLPIFVLLFIIILLIDRMNPLFLQERGGLYGKTFKIIKFKTMKNIFDNNQKLLPDKDRITSLGKFLRKTSLDEIPSLFNVLKGDISLVGPRPFMAKYLPLYNSTQAKRHDVRPGITGWAQVNGRNTISWEEKFELDIWYVDNQSFFLDLKILLLTLKKVIAREGISADGEETMPKFTGSNQKDNK